MSIENKTLKRQLYADVLRIIAAFSVVFQHTASSAWYSVSPSSDSFLALNFFNSIARFGVGVFIMISGAFLLSSNKYESPKLFFKTKLSHLLKLIVFWVLFYGIFQNIIQQNSFKDFLSVPLLIFTKPQNHLWFLYMLAGLYLFTPAIKIFTDNASEKILRYTLIGLFIFGMVVPSASHLIERFTTFDIYNNLTIRGTTSFFIYYLAGHYFAKHTITQKSKIVLYILGVVSLVISFAGSTFLSLQRNVPDEYFFGNLRPTNFLMVIAIFLLVKKLCQEKQVTHKWVTLLSATTLGIYLIHPIFLKLFYGLKFQLLEPSPWINVPLTAISIFGLSFALTLLFRKIPFFKKFL